MTKKSDEEWQGLLSPLAFQVTRKNGTERPFTGVLNNEVRIGRYECVCGQALLRVIRSSMRAVVASFFRVVSPNAVTEIEDHSHGMRRVEVRCSQCDAHLGHVFPDGPPPTGLRYCMNSVALRFLSQDGETVVDR